MLNKLNKVYRYSWLKNSFNTPPFLIFFVTSRCNASCAHCFNWNNLNTKNDLSLEEIADISLQFDKIDSLLLSGGEPFLRNDLAEICRLFFENNKVSSLSIPTNGLDTASIIRETEKILKAAGNKKIFVRISLDGTQDLHDRIRSVPGAFKKAIESYKRLAGLEKFHPNLNVGINATLSNKNYKNIYKLTEDLQKILPGLCNFNISLLRGNPKDKECQLPPEYELVRSYEHVKNCFGKNQALMNKAVNDTIFNLNVKILKSRNQILTCQAGRMIGVIDANGDVRLCELLDPIGNLREALFSEIWQSQISSEHRKKISNHQCWCTHECFIYPTILAYPGYYPALLFNLVKNWAWTII